MSLATIRFRYNCPAEKGMLIRVWNSHDNTVYEGTIIGSRDNFLKIRLADGSVRLCHPTWEIEYLRENEV
jgi:hypothetical protein